MDSNLAIALKNLSDMLQTQYRDIAQLQKEHYAKDLDIKYKAERIAVLEKVNSEMLSELRELKNRDKK